MSSMIRTWQLTKRFGGLKAVDEVNLHIRKGEIYGLFGANGSGKTTLMKMLLQLIHPTEGKIALFGEWIRANAVRHRGKIGSLIGQPAFYDRLTGKENLQLHAAYLGFQERGRVDEVLLLAGLSRSAGEAVGTYSVGMRQRLGIARALLHRPELLLLDEPLNGLDPDGAGYMVDRLAGLQREEQVTILVASHQPERWAGCLQAAGCMREGRLVAEWRPQGRQTPEENHRALLDAFAAHHTVTAGGSGKCCG